MPETILETLQLAIDELRRQGPRRSSMNNLKLRSLEWNLKAMKAQDVRGRVDGLTAKFAEANQNASTALRNAREFVHDVRRTGSVQSPNSRAAISRSRALLAAIQRG